MADVDILHFSDDEEANRYLAEEPLALLVGALLDQQVPMEWAFRSPRVLADRLGGDLSAERVAAMSPDELAEIFSTKPALHRYPGSMAKRVHALCEHLVEHHGGRAEDVWEPATDARDLVKRLTALPGFGKDKSRVFVAVLGRRLGFRPEGWEEQAADWPSVADADGPGAIARIREAKAAWKAEQKQRSGKQR